MCIKFSTKGAIKSLNEHIEKSLGYKKQGNTVKYLKSLEEVLKIYGEQAQIYYNLVDLYASNTQMEQALIAMHRLISLEPENPSHYRMWGMLYFMHNDPREVITYITKAIII